MGAAQGAQTAFHVPHHGQARPLCAVEAPEALEPEDGSRAVAGLFLGAVGASRRTCTQTTV